MTGIADVLAIIRRELHGRTLAPADSRAFGTHVSNTDLVGVWAFSPLTAVRLWNGCWQDTLEGLRAAACGRFVGR